MQGAKTLIDAHVHLAVLGRSPEQGWVSPALRDGHLGRLLRRRLGLGPDDPERLSRAFRDWLARELQASRRVRAAVVLALDGVYDEGGRLDLARTHLYVPNDAVLDLARRNPAILPGVSINPRRRDALAELGRTAERGAVLVKWLPNAQLFDPADPAFGAFYRQLEELELPLLIHSGREFSIPSRAQAWGDPGRWLAALEQGVPVVAAHGGSSGLPFEGRKAREFLALLERFPNLWADSSALGMPNRVGMLSRLRRRGLIDRLSFGTDWPVPCFPSLVLLRGRLRAWLRLRAERNYFDRYVGFFEAMGWVPSSAPLERLMAVRAGVA